MGSDFQEDCSFRQIGLEGAYGVGDLAQHRHTRSSLWNGGGTALQFPSCRGCVICLPIGGPERIFVGILLSQALNCPN